MNQIAFICETTFIYWTPIILTLAAVSAICVYAGTYLLKGGKSIALFVSLPLCVFLSFLFGRFIHWYCRPGVYSSFAAAMTDYTQGDFALAGVFIACLLTASVLRLTRLSDSLPKMLDALTLGGCVGIPVGRMASMFNGSDCGMILPDGIGFPFAFSFTNAVSGATENRLATFMIQSLSTGLIALLLIAFLIRNRIQKKKLRDGDLFLIFLTAYCSCQIVCDSTRYDSLILRSNGFISMVQIVSMVGLLLSVVVFSIRMVKNNGLKYPQFLLWGGILAMLGLTGYMEYFVQNNSTKALFAYSVMAVAMLSVVALTLTIRRLGARPPAAAEATEKAEVVDFR